VGQGERECGTRRHDCCETAPWQESGGSWGDRLEGGHESGPCRRRSRTHAPRTHARPKDMPYRGAETPAAARAAGLVTGGLQVQMEWMPCRVGSPVSNHGSITQRRADLLRESGKSFRTRPAKRTRIDPGQTPQSPAEQSFARLEDRTKHSIPSGHGNGKSRDQEGSHGRKRSGPGLVRDVTSPLWCKMVPHFGEHLHHDEETRCSACNITRQQPLTSNAPASLSRSRGVPLARRRRFRHPGR
jgi:hypothetical protein